MKSIFHLQQEFLLAGDVKTALGITGKDELELALTLINEERDELAAEEAYTENGYVEDLKECIDLIYVCAQYLNTAVGADKANALFTAVHNNNMEKCIDGKLVKREDGKILKPEGFNKHGWKLAFNTILTDM